MIQNSIEAFKSSYFCQGICVNPKYFMRQFANFLNKKIRAFQKFSTKFEYISIWIRVEGIGRYYPPEISRPACSCMIWVIMKAVACKYDRNAWTLNWAEHTYISEWFITFAIDNYRIVGGVCGALRAISSAVKQQRNFTLTLYSVFPTSYFWMILK